jgi:hypothetical protein
LAEKEIEAAQIRDNSNIIIPGRKFAMKTIRVLLVLAMVSISSLAFAQNTVTKGTQAWTDLEKHLADINDSGSAPINITRTTPRIVSTSRIRFGPKNSSRSACREK